MKVAVTKVLDVAKKRVSFSTSGNQRCQADRYMRRVYKASLKRTSRVSEHESQITRSVSGIDWRSVLRRQRRAHKRVAAAAAASTAEVVL